MSSVSLSRRSFAGVALTGVGALVLTACGGSSSSESPSSSSASSAGISAAPSDLPEGMGTDAASGVFPRTVGHFRGETTLEARPERVVVIATGQLDDALALGVVPVAATMAKAKDADMVPEYLRTAYSQYSSELDSMTAVGNRTAPDTEAIANLNPDLILLNNQQDDDSIYESLSAIAPIVVTEGTGVNWKQDFQILAAALGNTDEASDLLDRYYSEAQALGDAIDDSQTFSFLRQTSDRIRIWGVSSFVGSICEDARIARPESQQVDKTSVDISAEQLDQANGTWLFYGVQGGDASGLTSEALWETLEPVANGQAVQVDDEMFYINAGITAAMGVIDRVKEAVSA